MLATSVFSIINLICLIFMFFIAGLFIYVLILLIKALKIYIKKNSD